MPLTKHHGRMQDPWVLRGCQDTVPLCTETWVVPLCAMYPHVLPSWCKTCCDVSAQSEAADDLCCIPICQLCSIGLQGTQ